ncbi:MAG: TrmH family RNA methyltransferase [Balneolaceae bacterium]|nr:MAG: TrmH family RNA methyltransferase [Balneolaceae bacterium]
MTGTSKRRISKQQTAFFEQYVSEHKKKLFQYILNNRTRFFTVVLEDIYQSQNASAVLRSCDAFGIQDVHVIENRNVFDVDKSVTIGSEKWLDVHRYRDRHVNNTEIAYRELRERGYRIVATTPHEKQVALPDYVPDQPAALVFGTEKLGLTSYAIAQADEWLHIPMHGFSESFNISVSVALCLYHLRRHLDEQKNDWNLTPEEKEVLYLLWLRKSVHRLPALDRKFKELLENSSLPSPD